jgi:trans-aconitate 2-methyltransferase
MSDWNPESYLKFEQERTQPVRDLVARIDLQNPARIIDLGCGPGNSTAVLKERWPSASVIGLDKSAAMIEKAKKTRTDIEWLQGDAAADLSRLGTFDIVFANASLHWLPDHSTLVPRLFRMLKPSGVLAAQVPKFAEMPSAHAIIEVTRLPEYAGFFEGFDSGLHAFDDSLYYEILHREARGIELWLTYYYHVLENHEAIIEWIKSTGMRPYLDCLPGEEQESFTQKVLALIKALYAQQSDGKVLFLFKRFFFMAFRS